MTHPHSGADDWESVWNAETRQRQDERNEAVYAYVVDYCRRHGFPPTIREIMRGAGVSSTSMTVRSVKALEEAGRLERSRPHAGASSRIVVPELRDMPARLARLQRAAAEALRAAHKLGAENDAPFISLRQALAATLPAKNTKRNTR